MLNQNTFGWQKFSRKGATLILAFSWIFGFTSGFGLCFAANETALSLMRGCVFASVSIVWLFVLSLIPFLFSALAVLFSFPVVLYLVCFFRALVFGFVIAGLDKAWGNMAWLIRFGLLFEDLLLVPALYLFCHRRLRHWGALPWGECAALMLWVSLAVITKDRFVEPFFAEIMIL